ncbi:MAG: helix-turn-helix domain-containing protein [Alphaproteobacteria bacterium]
MDQPNSSENNWHTVSDIADRYAVHPNTVRSWIRNGRLVAHKLDRVVRISDHDLLTFEETSLAPMGVDGQQLRRSASAKAPPSSARLKRTRSKKGASNG